MGNTRGGGVNILNDYPPLIWSAIKCPVLIICGEEDGTTPPGGHVRMHRSIDHSELVIDPLAGHFPNIETPEEYSTAILAFLDKVN